MLAVAVVIHFPDFFRAAAIAHEDDLAFGNARQASTQTKDNFIGKTMGDEAGVVLRRVFSVLLSENLRSDRVFHVVEPSENRKLSSAKAEIAKGQHGRIGGGISPCVDLYVLRVAWLIERIETFGNDIEDAGILQVGKENLVEGRLQWCGIRIGGGRLEVGHGNANSFDALCDD